MTANVDHHEDLDTLLDRIVERNARTLATSGRRLAASQHMLAASRERLAASRTRLCTVAQRPAATQIATERETTYARRFLARRNAWAATTRRSR